MPTNDIENRNERRQTDIIQIKSTFIGIAFSIITIAIAMLVILIDEENIFFSFIIMVLIIIGLLLLIFSKPIANFIYNRDIASADTVNALNNEATVIPNKLPALLKTIAVCFFILGVLSFIGIISLPILVKFEVINSSELMTFIFTFFASGIISLIVSFLAIKIYSNT
jgi:hypothetical protein